MQRTLPKCLGIVAYEMEGFPTGVGRYLEGLLSGLAQTQESVTYRLFFRGAEFDHPLWTRSPSGPGVSGPRFEAVFDGRPASHPILWEQLRLPRLLRQHGVEALFSPCYSLPQGPPVPSLVTLHDLSFEHLRAEFGFVEGWRRRFLARRAAQRATRVLTDTRAMSRDVQRTYGTDPGKMGVVPLAVGRRFVQAPPAGDPKVASSDEVVLRGLNLEGPYVLFLGSLLPRRRVDLLIEAFRQLAPRHPDLRLVLSGHNALPNTGDLDGWIRQSGLEGRVVQLGYVPEEALLPLYRGAVLTYYISTYEGYGIPPLESLALGVPVVVSSGLALDDLWPDYPLRLDRLTAEDLRQLSQRGLQLSPYAKQELVLEGRKLMARLTWQHCAETFLDQVSLAMTRQALP